MPDIKKIVIAEDHTILREGLRMLLSSNPGFEVVGEAQDGLEAIRLVDAMKPDLILMDLSMPRMNGGLFRKSRSKVLPQKSSS